MLELPQPNSTKTADPVTFFQCRKEWLNMKKEYQKLQRQAMKDAKQELRIDFEVKVEKSKEDKADTLEGNENITNNKKREPPQKLEMQPGVVLRFSCDENTDKRKLKV